MGEHRFFRSATTDLRVGRANPLLIHVFHAFLAGQVGDQLPSGFLAFRHLVHDVRHREDHRTFLAVHGRDFRGAEIEILEVVLQVRNRPVAFDDYGRLLLAEHFAAPAGADVGRLAVRLVDQVLIDHRASPLSASGVAKAAYPPETDRQ